jgi:hypothetical protein
MLIGVTPPDPRCAAPGKGSVQALYACLPERCPVPREGAVGGDARAGVPALQLRALRDPGPHLSALRSRQRVLRRGVRRYPPARVAEAGPEAVSEKPPWCVAARRPATPVARAATTKTIQSDASRIPSGGDPVHRGNQSRHAEPTRRCNTLRTRAAPQEPSAARYLRVLWCGAARVEPPAAVALERMMGAVASRRSIDDLASPRDGDPAAASG